MDFDSNSSHEQEQDNDSILEVLSTATSEEIETMHKRLMTWDGSGNSSQPHEAPSAFDNPWRQEEYDREPQDSQPYRNEFNAPEEVYQSSQETTIQTSSSNDFSDPRTRRDELRSKQEALIDEIQNLEAEIVNLGIEDGDTGNISQGKWSWSRKWLGLHKGETQRRQREGTIALEERHRKVMEVATQVCELIDAEQEERRCSGLRKLEIDIEEPWAEEQDEERNCEAV